MSGIEGEIRTSASHPIQVNWLTDDLYERVGLTFAPGKKSRSNRSFAWDRDLAADLARLAGEYRAGVLVTLMEEAELASVGIADLFNEARRQGIEPLHFPIPDVRAPGRPSDIDPLLHTIETHLAQGTRVVIHCLGGIGRTGTIATCLLVRRGFPIDRAVRTVQRVRCRAFPESAEQDRFVHAYARHAATGASASVHGLPTTSEASAWPDLGDAAISSSARSANEVSRLLASIERTVAASPADAFTADASGAFTLHANGTSYHAGRFETPTIGELKARLRAQGRRGGRLRLSVLRGASAYGDIGHLQATAPPGTLFQVASQFNTLEAPGPRIVVVRDYPFDSTQGPRAAVSAFPGTFLRHYVAPGPDGQRFVQTDAHAIDLLVDALPASAGRVRSGYLTPDDLADPSAAARALHEHFDRIRIGLHDDVEVVFGTNWGGLVPGAPGQRIAQAFTSTMALSGSHGDEADAVSMVCRQLLRAAYLGTLLGALSLGCQRVVLTMIGGGVFGNPHRAIWDAIHWSLDIADAFADDSIEVVVNLRHSAITESDRVRIRERGGRIIDHDHSGCRTERP